MKTKRSPENRLMTVLLLILAGVGGAAAPASAQSEPERPGEIGPAERSAAIRRVLADRSRSASPVGRATAAMHRSLVRTEQLVGAAIREGRMPRADDEAIRALILEGQDLRVAYETVQSGLADRNEGSRPRPAVHSRSRRSRASGGIDATRARSVPAPGTSAFGHVERVLALHEQLAQVTEMGVGARAAPILRELQREAARSLQSIRRDSFQVSGVVYGAGPEVRRDPIRSSD